MAQLFTQDYWPLWMVVLALALFLPVRRLIWVLYVRRAQRNHQVDAAEQAHLRKRATATAALVCFVFSYFYTRHLFKDRP
jgi:uncharacterized paraquat-inducible protein A